MSLSSNISSARKNVGLTQEQLAEKCGVSRQAVTKWESGESEPTIAKLVILSEVLQIDLTELVTGKKNEYQKNEQCIPEFDYPTLSAFTSNLTNDYYRVDEKRKLLIIEILFGVIKTKYINSDEEIFEKYLLKNTTKEERAYCVKFLQFERKFARDIFQEYVDGKCEIDDAFERLICKIEDRYSIESKIENKKDESEIAEIYHGILRNSRIIQEYDEFSEKKQAEAVAELNGIMDELSENVPIEHFLIIYIKEILKAWDKKDIELIGVLRNSLWNLKEVVWDKIEI